ncbi:MAG: amidophosphoribosyltransferase [Kordiimonadaceae bacterium]|nr:amidophosphoribosyltransferase [Kordiimonadaceae bacterium]
MANQFPLSTNPFDPSDDDKLREECGVFGIYGTPDATAHCTLGLHALQHRGQEAAGITAIDGDVFHIKHAIGHVADNFTQQDVIDSLPGNAAIGHVRYSTAGGGGLRNCQPIFAELAFGGFAVAHNGNISNAQHIRKSLVQRGSIFQSESDTETIVHLLAMSKYRKLMDRFVDAISQLEGAFALVALTKEGLIGFRDPLGIRPLILGKLDGNYILCSESCALDILGAEYLREIAPGELVIITEGKIETTKPFPDEKPRPCIFEHVYFARPDSFVNEMNVYSVRKRIGAELAIEAPVDVDMVIPVPDSGTPSAIGYAQQANIPFELGIIRNHYVGRTFIEPSDQIRHLGVKLKLNANRQTIKGKRIVLVDDSIVRGTTSMKIVNLMRDAGALEVHMRIASPPTAHSCFYGVDTPERKKLLAARMDIEAMRKHINADSLTFISIDGLYKATNQPNGRDSKCPAFCDACFTGDYPTSLTDQAEQKKDDNQLEMIASPGT